MDLCFRLLEEDIVAQFIQMTTCHSYCMSLFPKDSKKDSYNSQNEYNIRGKHSFKNYQKCALSFFGDEDLTAITGGSNHSELFIQSFDLLQSIDESCIFNLLP